MPRLRNTDKNVLSRAKSSAEYQEWMEGEMVLAEGADWNKAMFVTRSQNLFKVIQFFKVHNGSSFIVSVPLQGTMEEVFEYLLSKHI